MISENPITSESHGTKTHRFQNKLKILLGGVCCLLFLLITVLSIPVYVFRVLVILLAKVFRPDLGDILNGLSSYHVNDYFYNSKSPRASIIVSLVFHGRDIPLKELKELLLKRWITAKDSRSGKLTFPQFQQYPVRWMGFTFWKNCMNKFSINNHVFLEEQKVVDGVDDEKLNNICEQLLNAPYPSNQSPWEVHLVKNYKTDQLSIRNNHNSEDQTAYVILFKVHHGLADGYSILNALVEVLGQNSLTNVKLPAPTFPKRNFCESINYYITIPFSAFYEFSYILSNMFCANPWKVPDNKKEWYQFCAKSDLIPIHKIKFIKSQLCASFTSVLLSAISSAISQSTNNGNIKNLNIESKECFEKEQNDRSIYCMSVLPLPGHSKRLTNSNTYALFDLPINECDNSLERLHKVDNMLESTKNSCLPSIVPLYISAIGCNFYSLGNLIGKQRMVVAGLTNFPGVPIKIEQNGRTCVASDFIVGALNGVAGMAIMVLSHGEYIRLAVTVEKAVMSKDEVNRFVKDVINEIEQLYICCRTQH